MHLEPVPAPQPFEFAGSPTEPDRPTTHRASA